MVSLYNYTLFFVPLKQDKHIFITVTWDIECLCWSLYLFYANYEKS